MRLLGYITMDESVDRLNGFGREVLPMLQEEYLGKTFLCYENDAQYMLTKARFIPECSGYPEISAQIISANNRDVGLDIEGIHVDFKKFPNSLHSFHVSKSLEDVFEEEPLQKAS